MYNATIRFKDGTEQLICGVDCFFYEGNVSVKYKIEELTTKFFEIERIIKLCSEDSSVIALINGRGISTITFVKTKT